MATQNITITKASSVVPWIGRFLITTLEPLFAVGGVVLCLTKPEDYLSGLTRESVTSIDPLTKFVYTELGGGWLVIIFAESVIMRLVDTYASGSCFALPSCSQTSSTLILLRRLLAAGHLGQCCRTGRRWTGLRR
ncbi:hypothetical protein HII31_00670 [Pseudocercospora fuligena]|uniref:Uncharacterized protein n=1 Tax=Pseudocercospora fuligena TaxID=685502 RepID=A0A8H6RT70_9PEZI|nr:hypothetical protein HII31_00670 [Pseudocercospora fuligena]